ncbi:UDP-glycosyltransferase 708G1-like [Gastrolobium bilobum]|uniref:UDP-glycosyltransferase 708G1-like n=1 Tax=Gastrolobium bilobum TaxID=150636 RepID=UPI002AB14184|nr:UDP-glycosyltransferase 708G1-like [Gastrolobium bilobum]
MSDDVVHVALLPSAGMGHLTPFLRLAAMLLHHHCKVTLITPHPTVSHAESQLLSRFQSSFPQVNQIQFHLEPLSSSTPNNSSADPFFLRVHAIRDSAHLLSPLLSSLSPPLSSFVSDVFLISSLLPITDALSLPNYLLFTSSAAMFSFFSHFHTLSASLPGLDVVDIPGISPIPTSSIPPVLLQPDTLFRNFFMEDSPKVTKFHGVLVNTFVALEPQSLEALNAGKVVRGMPPVYAIGPFVPCEFEKVGQLGAPLKWLDDQPNGSVVYVGFGSRTAMGRDQIREIGDGLVRSGCRFLWVVKDKIVDREEEVGLDEVLGVELVERLREKGLVMKEWVDQSEILGHRAVGGFVSHCGWNSLMEAAWYGVPILAWPQHGDQKINADVVEMNGLGIWNKNWGWGGERVVKGEEIGEAIKEMMKNEYLKVKAAQLKEVGRKAMSVGGDCEVTLQKLMEELKKNINNV